LHGIMEEKGAPTSSRLPGWQRLNNIAATWNLDLTLSYICVE
jgi:hypothetical protein